MTTFFEFIILALPSTVLVGAVLFFSRRHVHQQMEGLAKEAKINTWRRRMHFRSVPNLPDDIATAGVFNALELRSGHPNST
jgi:hypothetical protein